MKRLLKITVAYILTFVMVLSLAVSYQKITVNAATGKYVKSLSVKSSITVEKGKKKYVSAKVKTVGKADKKLTVKSKNKKIAKVSYKSSGNIITVTGVKKGNTKVTVTTKAKNKNGKKISKTIKVSVTDNSSNTSNTTSESDTQAPSSVTSEAPKNEATTETKKNDGTTETKKNDEPKKTEESTKPSEPSNPVTSQDDIDMSNVKISNTGKVLNIYTWNDEFARRLADHYPGYVRNDEEDATAGGKIGDVEVRFIVTASANNEYQNNLDNILPNNTKASSDDIVDIFLVESDYAFKYVNTDNALPVAALGIANSELDNQYSYTKDAVKDSNGIIRGATWQACPGVMIYNREIAKDVFGTDDPKTIQTHVSDWDKYREAAKSIADKGYKMNANVAETYRVFQDNVTSPRVVNGKINVDDHMKTWAEMSKYFIDGGISNVGNSWDNGWNAGFYPDGNVFCYFGPEWLIDFCMAADDESSIAAQGGWGVCEGPEGFYWGGSWICAANGTDNSELVADIFRKLTIDDDVMSDIAVVDKDFVNNKKVMEELAKNSDFSNPILGGQNPLAQFSFNADRIKLQSEKEYVENYNNYYLSVVNDYFLGYYQSYNEAESTFFKIMSGEITDIPVKEIKLSDKEITLNLDGGFYMIDATTLPYSATDQELKWSSSNEDVVHVDDYGDVFVESVGTAEVTVTNEKSGVSATCTIHVLSN